MELQTVVAVAAAVVNQPVAALTLAVPVGLVWLLLGTSTHL
jgi:predicted membrane protein